MPRQIGSPQIRNAYRFLKEAETQDREFTVEELQQGSGWTLTTTKANISKKLSVILIPTNEGFKAVGLLDLTEEAFCRLCSQNSSLANDPQRPRLEPKVEGLVNKARDAALAAVQHYNNPTSLFRSDNYVVLMMIAYTALFHAVFERDAVDYKVYDEATGHIKTVAGEPMLWEVKKGANYYREIYGGKYDPKEILAMVQNIEFLLPIRHIIEHRYMPQLDTDIAGHCQAMLFNFERILTEEFTNYYSLNRSLSLALQFSTARSPETLTTLRRFQSAEYSGLKTYIADFEASLPDDIVANPAFAFRVWLIPKPANHARSSDMSIEFVPTEGLTVEQLSHLQNAVVAIKTKERLIDYSEICTLYEYEVVAQLKEKIGATVQFHGEQKLLTGAMIRYVLEAYEIASPSDMYFRPRKHQARPMYSQKFVDWIAEMYSENSEFFQNAKRQVQRPKDGA